MDSIFTDPERQQEFARNGYTLVRLLSGEEAVGLCRRIEALELGKGFARNSPNPYHATYFDEDVGYRRAAFEFVRSAIEDRAAALLNDYRIVTAGFVVKRPGDGPVSLHRDWTLTADPGQVTLNFWCPLVDADEANGTLRLVAGTHRLVPNVETAHVPSYFASYGEAIKRLAVPVRVKAGEALIFDSGMLHWSAENGSAEPRPALLATWIPRASQAVFYALDTDGGGRRFELFDMEDGALVEHRPEQLASRDFDRPSVGFVDNRNQPVPQHQFERLLESRGFPARPEDDEATGEQGLLRSLYRRVSAVAGGQRLRSHS
ncbi:MAG: phytanoyl-CoA dioxygenase family protein [Pseudomonadota bacterium]|nr:phytanoyl-CoA dioxygenase family protein [Pseudomonadota bacterium]